MDDAKPSCGADEACAESLKSATSVMGRESSAGVSIARPTKHFRVQRKGVHSYRERSWGAPTNLTSRCRNLHTQQFADCSNPFVHHSGLRQGNGAGIALRQNKAHAKREKQPQFTAQCSAGVIRGCHCNAFRPKRCGDQISGLHWLKGARGVHTQERAATANKLCADTKEGQAKH